MVRLTDQQIEALILEAKALPDGYLDLLRVQAKRTGKQSSLTVFGDQGHEFRIILRQSHLNHLDFSAILVHVLPGTNRSFRLRRYNGKTGEHSNAIERQKMIGYHIHYATERYQRRGDAEDAYAELTERYATLEEALECLLGDCGFVRPPGEQLSLFGQEV